MASLRVFSAKACPYAHRTRLVLAYKRVEFELVEIDLRNKPAWFGSVSLYGKVPALEHDGQRLVESAIINEYLEEVFPTPALLPREPARRALARIWIDFANTRLAPSFSRLSWGTPESERDSGARELSAALSMLSREALPSLSPQGPFWLGEAPSLVDFTFYPWFERLPALEALRGFSLSGEHERLLRWRGALEALPVVRENANPVEFYVERYRAYAAARAPERPR